MDNAAAAAATGGAKWEKNPSFHWTAEYGGEGREKREGRGLRRWMQEPGEGQSGRREGGSNSDALETRVRS